MSRIKAVVVGPGNIGTDLLLKALRSPRIEPRWSVGVVEASEGLRVAREHGVSTTHAGLEAVIDRLAEDGVRIAFDATSAKYHPQHDALLRARGIRVIDLTPASIGPYCVATVASRSIGPGTRNNIDEFTRTTRAGVEQVGGAKRGKAIIVINPADPPIIMRDTIHCLTEDEPDRAAITDSVHRMVADVQSYVPGYQLMNGPVFDGRRVTVWMEVAGLGDYLPRYAGNLDIMTAAALKTAELLAEAML
jgi:acetaldehyde/propanal dehydrogenase